MNVYDKQITSRIRYFVPEMYSYVRLIVLYYVLYLYL